MQTEMPDGNYIDTIVQLSKPVRVRYLTLNDLPFKHLGSVSIRKTGKSLEAGGFQSAPELQVEVDASILMVKTMVYPSGFRSFVVRVEEYRKGELLLVNPHWPIENFPLHEKVRDRTDAWNKHQSLVDLISSSDRNPHILYQGIPLLDEYFNGDKLLRTINPSVSVKQ